VCAEARSRCACHAAGRLLLLLALLMSCAAAPASGTLSPRELAGALRQGGYTIYFRHAQTDWSQDDRIQAAGDWKSCDPAQMRQLSAQGRRTAEAVGRAMRALAIPVGRVLASPYCRAVATAEGMGLAEVETTTAVMNLRAAEHFGGREAILARARRLLSAPPPAGSNTVIVAHGNVARALMAASPGEAEALVLRPQPAGGFAVLGQLRPQDWRVLAGAQ